MSLTALSCIIYMLMFICLSRENEKRERGDRDGVMAGLTEDEVLALGDENPRFMFAR